VFRIGQIEGGENARLPVAETDQSKLRLKLVTADVFANSERYVEEFRRIFGL
jgi:hypothetical protein